MRVQAITTFEQLRALEDPWNRLAGNLPFRSSEWLTLWWQHYGDPVRVGGRPSGKRLFVLVVDSAQGHVDSAGNAAHAATPIAIAPFFLESHVAKGNVLRLLGTGEVCSDHLSVLCHSADSERVAEAIAEFLTTDADDWDVLELAGIDQADQAVTALVGALQQRACEAKGTPAGNCWRIQLPSTWDEYLAQQSKSHRKQLRRAERRVLDSKSVTWHRIEHQREFERGWNILVDLHQRRRRSLAEPGCFASQPFHDFHRDVAARLLGRNQLRLSWLEMEGTPLAAEYHLASLDTTFAYQGGLDPDRLDVEPGRLSTLLCIQKAIEERHTAFDFLRGDEPYKAHWRAQPQPMVDYQIIPGRRLARLRGRAIQFAGSFSSWAKTGVQAIAAPLHEGT